MKDVLKQKFYEYRGTLLTVTYAILMSLFVPQAMRHHMGMQGIFFSMAGAAGVLGLLYLIGKLIAWRIRESGLGSGELRGYLSGYAHLELALAQSGYEQDSESTGSLVPVNLTGFAEYDLMEAIQTTQSSPYNQHILDLVEERQRPPLQKVTHLLPEADTGEDDDEHGRGWQERRVVPEFPPTFLSSSSGSSPERRPEREREQPRGIMAQNRSRALALGTNFCPDANEVTGKGIFLVGITGTGKTNAAALIHEELGCRFLLPMAVFDVEGDLKSMAEVLPNGMVATRNTWSFTGADILLYGIQVVFDLPTWGSNDEQAEFIHRTVRELLAAARAEKLAERELIPCLVGLDEAQYWLPQKSVSYLSPLSQRTLLEDFNELSTRGRKLGLLPFLFTQTIAETNKDVIRQLGIRIFMRAVQDNDLERYMEYIRKETMTKERITQLKRSEAVVCWPDGTQFVTSFYERQSRHTSHTPHVTGALTRYRHQPIPLPTPAYARTTVVPSVKPTVRQTDPLVEQIALPQPKLVSDPVPVNRKGTLTPELQQALDVYYPGMSYRELGNMLGVGKDTAGKYIQQLKDRRLIV